MDKTQNSLVSSESGTTVPKITNGVRTCGYSRRNAKGHEKENSLQISRGSQKSTSIRTSHQNEYVEAFCKSVTVIWLYWV